MIVQGYAVTPEQIAACVERMKKCPFEAFQIATVAERAGVPIARGVCDRLADRLIQREKKAGTIALFHRLWEPAGWSHEKQAVVSNAERRSPAQETK